MTSSSSALHTPPRRLSYVLLALLVVATAGYAFDLGGSSIWDANEAFYVETPREMLERGDWVNPQFNYEPRFNKPVLSYWIVAVLYRVFGVSIAVERVAIAAWALVMIVAAWLLGRAASAAWAAPLLAALGLAANPRMFMFARRILIDVMLAALMTLVLLFFALAERYPERRRLFLIAMYVAAGLGLLAKGPVAVALPAIVFFVSLVAWGEWRRLRDMMIPLGAVIVLAIGAPWYIALYLEGGWTHISEFFIGENLERYTSMFGPEGRGPLFYLPVLFSDSLPWSLCLPAACALWLKDRREAGRSIEHRLRSLLFLWVIVIVAFFSFSQTKQDLYIFPVVVAMAVLGADVAARAIAGDSRAAAWLRGTLIVTAVLLVAIGTLALSVIDRSRTVFALDGVGPAAWLALGGGLAVAGLILLRQTFAAVSTVLAIFVAFNWLMVALVLPSFERYKPVVPLSDTIQQHASADDRIVQYEAPMPSMVFYLRRHVDIVYDEQSFAERMTAAGGDAFGVLPERRYEELKPQLPVRTCVLDRRPIADVKLRDILEGRPPAALVLVSTRCP